MTHQTRVAMVDRRDACQFLNRRHDEGARTLSILRKMEDCLLHKTERVAGAISPLEWKHSASDPEVPYRDLWRFGLRNKSKPGIVERQAPSGVVMPLRNHQVVRV